MIRYPENFFYFKTTLLNSTSLHYKDQLANVDQLSNHYLFWK